MAKGKNEILLSIALEGDQDVKAKLQAVGEASKKSLGGIEKSLGDVGKTGFGGLGETAGKLTEALAPLTEASGLAGLASLSGLTGIFSRLAAGPAGIIAGIAGVVLGMAKIGEETDKSKLKLKALGASGDTFEKLNKTAKELGVSTEDLQPSFEKFAAAKNKINADQTSGVIRLRPNGATEADQAAAGVRVIGGGKETGAPVPDDVFFGALKTLVEGAQAEKIPGDQAGKIADAFSSKVQTDRKLSPEAVDTLNPASQNILAKSLSSFFGRDLLNGAELKEQLARPGQRAPSDNEVFRSLNAAEPEAHKQAESAYGLTAAFDALLAATKHLAEEFSGDVGIADAISKLVKVINDAADNADKIIHPRDYEPGGPKFIGPVSPAESAEYKKPDVIDLGKTLLTGKSDPRFDDSNAAKVAKFLHDGPSFLQGTPQEALDSYRNNRSSLPTTPPLITPEQLGKTVIPSPLDTLFPKQPAIPPGFERLPDGTIVKSSPPAPPATALPAAAPLMPDRTLDGLPIAPERPPGLAPLPPIQQGALPPQPSAAVQDVASSFTGLLDQLREKLVGPPSNKVEGPADAIGIRGEAESSGTATADASQSITTAGDKLAAALDGVTAMISSVQTNQPVKVQAEVQTAATGGEIRHLDDGGHLSGPGTSTSDSIPAMLSDGEYVIKASSAKKLGRSTLDRLNAGGFADGGAISRRLAKVRRLAEGGTARDDGTVSPTLASPGSSLGNGQHEILYDPTTGGAYVDGVLHLPGDPLLDDPNVRQGIAQSKAAANQKPSKNKYKSDFVGRFGHSDDADTYVAGGGPIGNWSHFAKGGAVGHIAPMLHLADGGAADGVSGSAPTLDGAALAAPGGSLGHLDVDLRTNHGDFKMMAPEDVARQMNRAAGDAAIAQTGARPSWYKGR